MRTVTLAAVALGTVLAVGGEHRQIERIARGVRSGELTRRETARLLAEQAYIRAEEYRFRHTGGGLSPRERLRLQRDLNRASRHIYRQTHDGQTRLDGR
jgi:hypothetical protein